MRDAWKLLIADAGLILLLVVVAYLPMNRAGFIWDDGQLITENRIIRASDGLRRIWFTTDAQDYYPITNSLWWLEWRVWGKNPKGYHAVNVFLHAANAILVWLILRRLKIPGAWLAGVVFAIHPVNVATVAWISEQKNILSMFFYTTAILLYLKFDEDNRWYWYGLSSVAFLLALLSKSAVVALPIVLLGCVWWLRGRVNWKDFTRVAPFFVLSLVFGLVTIWFQHHRAIAGYAPRTTGFSSRLAAAGWVPWFYLSKALLPYKLCVIYPTWEIDSSRILSWVPGAGLLACFVVFCWNRNRWGRILLFGLGYFVVTLFPVWGLIDQGFYGYSLVSDHWQYYSIIGVIALPVAFGERFCQRMGKKQQAVVALGAVVIVVSVFGVLTYRRAQVYSSSQTLWQDTLTKNSRAWVAYGMLGNAFLEDGKIEEAIEEFRQALRLKPDYDIAHNDLGLCFWRLGKVPEAIEQYQQAVRINPDCFTAQDNLGIALYQSGRVEEAMEHWKQALRFMPDDAELCNSFGIALAQSGKSEEAIEYFRRALRIEPEYFQVRVNLGNTFVGLGKLQEAIGEYEGALQCNPNCAEALCNLGVISQRLGKLQEAIGYYERALRIKPDYAEARHNLSLVLEKTGRVP